MKRKRTKIGLFVLSLVLVLLPSAAFGSLDNKGTEFLMGFLPNYTNAGNLELHLTGDTATTVTVEYPVGTVIGTHSVTPGSVTIVSIPVEAQQWSADTVASRLVRASAPVEFVAYMTNILEFTSDAALALPVDTLNTEYILADYNALRVSFPAEFVVFAAYDNTTVTINPTADINGHAAGTPFSVVLDAGEGYFNSTTGPQSTATLTGSIITADRPVGVTNGVACTNVPIGYGACDHTFEVAQPVQSWGTRIGVANLPLRDTTFYRILASQDDTTVTQDGSIIATLDRGDYHEVGLGGNHVFEADKPIYVVQFMPGQGYPGSYSTGDPAQGNMIPFDQYLTDYTFSTVGGGQFARNFVTIIANDADVGTLTLDGTPVAAASFSPVGASGYSAAQIELTEGTHSTSSAHPHGITVEGYNSFDSYIYPGGALFQFINPVGDSNAPIITLTTNAGPPPYADGVATDDRPSEDTNGNGILDPGEDLNGNGLIDEDTGIFFVELETGATNLVLTVDPFVPGDGVATFTVSLSDPLLSGSGNVLVTDGAGNVTSQFVELVPILNRPPVADTDGPYSGDEGSQIGLDGTGSSDSDGDPLTFAWSVDSALCTFDDATIPSPNLTCTDNGDFTVTLTVDDGQATDSDTATVTVANVAPAVSIDSVAPALVAVGEDVTAAGSFTDPGTNDTHTAEWDWGDGTSAGTVGGLSVGPDSHTYAAAGIYTLQLTATDDDGGEGTALYEYVVVYDPNAGFVTGGGWIDSPAGAYVPDPTLTGKANFGFVAKYKKGANVPDGNTEFRLQTAGLNFHSSSYDWLVVTGSDYARFKGVGTLNGEGAYNFMLWAGDGTGTDGSDTFRIKIWEEDEFGVETVIYDNGMGQDIGGGSIVVHTKKK